MSVHATVCHSHSFPTNELATACSRCSQVTGKGAHAQNSYSREELAHAPLFLPGKVWTFPLLGLCWEQKPRAAGSQSPTPLPTPLWAACLHTAPLSSVVRGLNSCWGLVPAGSTWRALYSEAAAGPGDTSEAALLPPCALSSWRAERAAGGSDLAQPDHNCHYGWTLSEAKAARALCGRLQRDQPVFW